MVNLSIKCSGLRLGAQARQRINGKLQCSMLYSTITQQHPQLQLDGGRPIDFDIIHSDIRSPGKANGLFEGYPVDDDTMQNTNSSYTVDKEKEEKIINQLIHNLRNINSNFFKVDGKGQIPLNVSSSSTTSSISDRALAQKINLLIVSLKSYYSNNAELKYPIRIGVKQLGGEAKKKSVLNALLGDPLSGSQEWYHKFKDRLSSQNNLTVYFNRYIRKNGNGQEKDPQTMYKVTENMLYPANRQLTLWQIRTPILSAEARLRNFNNLQNLFGESRDINRIKLNNLEFLEINNDQVGNCNVNGVMNAAQREEEDIMYEFYREIDNELEELDIGDGCHLYLYYTDSELVYPMRETFPYLLIVDKENFEATKNEVKDVNFRTIVNKENLTMNSKLAVQANEILMENFGETSAYIKNLNASNLLKLIYLLNITTVNNENIIQLLKVINRAIAMRFFHTLDNSSDANNNVQLEKLQALYDSVNHDIQEWARNANFFLQQQFLANLNSYEKSKLVWWKLLYINDDIDYYLEVMVSQALQNTQSSNFVTIKGDSFLDYFNYIEGKIDSYTNKTSSPAPEKDNMFLQRISPEIINIQNKVVESLTTNLVGIELPAVVVSILGGHYMYGYDLYSMGAIVAVSTAIVCNNISRQWSKTMKQFKKTLVEALRVEIRNKEDALRQKWARAYKGQQNRAMENERLMKQFSKNVTQFEELTKAGNK